MTLICALGFGVVHQPFHQPAIASYSMLRVRGLKQETVTLVANLAVQPNKKAAELAVEWALFVLAARTWNHFLVQSLEFCRTLSIWNGIGLSSVNAFSTSVFFRVSSVFFFSADHRILKRHDLVVGAEFAAVNEHGLQFLSIQKPVRKKKQRRIGLPKFLRARNAKVARIGQFAILSVKIKYDQVRRGQFGCLFENRRDSPGLARTGAAQEGRVALKQLVAVEVCVCVLINGVTTNLQRMLGLAFGRKQIHEGL